MNIKNVLRNSLRKRGFEIVKSSNGFSINNNLNWFISYNFDTILDIGANEGQYALFIKKYFPDAALFSFEPIKKCFDEIKKNCKHLKNFSVLNYALGNENKTEDFHLNEFSASSSLLN